MNRQQRRADQRRDRPAAEIVFGAALAHHQAGRLDAAIAGYDDVLRARPDFPEAHNNRGIALNMLGRTEDAVPCFARAVDLRPTFPEALTNLGNARQDQGRLGEAIACFRRALAARPDFHQAHYNLGNALKRQGRLAEAVACFRAALDLKPGLADAHTNLAGALEGLGRRAEALACYRRACDLRPDEARAHYNLGHALGEDGQTEAAIACYRAALALQPVYPDARNNLGNALRELGRLDEAVACFHAALGEKPDFPEAHTNLAAALRDQGRLDEAAAQCHAALAERPDFAEAHNTLGAVLREHDTLEAAIACYRRAIALKPDLADAHFNLALALLARGDFPAGWAEYEWRWRTREMAPGVRAFPVPQWDGGAISGKTLLIHAEQGFGDTLQFCRYAPLVAARGARVILEAPGALVRLLENSDLGIDRVIVAGTPLPDGEKIDVHCPMLSLPLAFGTTLGSIPAPRAYLRADPDRAAAWRARLAMLPAGLKIGLAWAGNPRAHSPSLAAVDRRRSIAPALLAPLAAVPGVTFVSLRKDGPAAPADFPLLDGMAEMDDFADTAALVTGLDLVISVDTAVAHLAAGLGTPVWLLDRFDPCWRWLLGRRDSPWYPTLRIHRQTRPGDWTSVIAAVAYDLMAEVAGGAAAAGRGP